MDGGIGDFHLQGTSPAKDNGLLIWWTYVTTQDPDIPNGDKDGRAVGTIDQGCYELQ